MLDVADTSVVRVDFEARYLGG